VKLRAGREHRNARSLRAGQSGDTRGRQCADVRSTEPNACLDDHVPGMRVATARANVLALGEARLHLDRVVTLDNVLDGMTASAPSGTTPPVEIDIASPAARGRSAGRPAAICATIGSRPGRSAARTAYPSIAELANGGRSTIARAGSAVTRPAAAPIATFFRRQRPRVLEHLRLRLLHGE